MTDQRKTSLRKRLLPLHVAVALQGLMLWVPVEKLRDFEHDGLIAISYVLVADDERKLTKRAG